MDSSQEACFRRVALEVCHYCQHCSAVAAGFGLYLGRPRTYATAGRDLPPGKRMVGRVRDVSLTRRTARHDLERDERKS